MTAHATTRVLRCYARRMIASTATPANDKPTGMLAGLAYGALGFGALGLLAPVFSLGSRGITRLIGSLTKNSMLLRLDELLWTGSYGAWTRISMALGVALSATLLAAGFGFLKRRAWAGQLLTLYAAFQILFVLANLAITFTVLVPAMRALAADYANDPAANAGLMSGVASALLGSVFGLLLPIVFVVLLRRPRVRAELRT